MNKSKWKYKQGYMFNKIKENLRSDFKCFVSHDNNIYETWNVDSTEFK